MTCISVASLCQEGWLLLGLAVCGAVPCCEEKQPEVLYAVVIDAGSTGSRAMAITFHRYEDGILRLPGKSVQAVKVKPGLSNFRDNPQEARVNVEKLLGRVKDFVPEDRWSSTPLVLRGTAGLRLLPLDKQEAILDEVRELLLGSEFNTTVDPAKVLTGSEEAIYDWITVNLLLGRLDGNPKLMTAALDMGGASTQVAFPLLGNTSLEFPQGDVRDVRLADQTVSIYAKSYLGLGASATRIAVLTMNNPLNSRNLTSPCVQSDNKAHRLVYNGVKYIVNGVFTAENFQSAVNVENCTKLVKEFITFSEVAKPSGILEFDEIGFSGFYYTSKNAGLLDSDNGGIISVEDLSKAVTKVCANEGAEHRSPFLCLDLIYIHTLLTDGYGFPSSTKLKVVGVIHNNDVNWALGFAYELLLNRTSLQ